MRRGGASERGRSELLFDEGEDARGDSERDGAESIIVGGAGTGGMPSTAAKDLASSAATSGSASMELIKRRASERHSVVGSL